MRRGLDVRRCDVRTVFALLGDREHAVELVAQLLERGERAAHLATTSGMPLSYVPGDRVALGVESGPPGAEVDGDELLPHEPDVAHGHAVVRS